MAGLGTREALARLREHGLNEIDATERRGWGATLREVAAEPMFVLLVAGALLYLVIGELSQGLLLAVFAAVTVGMVILQERRSERALDALRSLAAPHARVFRDGTLQRIPARDMVPGDVFTVGEGERVPADAVLREGHQLSVDESLLTGESVAVAKHPHAERATGDAGAGTEDAALYASTLVVAGHGIAEVVATGRHTRAGGIGVSLASIATSATPLQLHMRRIVRLLGAGALAMSAVLAAWHGIVRGEWTQGILAGIAAAMAMLPEEFPMALAVFLALGAWRLAGVKVLARRPAVIEALGGATVLCVDKTGTLTENRMRVRRLVTADDDVALGDGLRPPEHMHAVLDFAALASRRGALEPMDRAIFTEADAWLGHMAALREGWQLAHEFPVTPELPATSQAWVDGDGAHSIAAKGAPEAIAHLCHLDEAATRRVLAQAAALAAEGLRVLGVARASETHDSGHARVLHDYAFEWVGLVALEDPLRASVPAAVAQAHAAGIAVVMITGDHAATALAIARQAGIAAEAGVLTGDALAAMDDARLRHAVRAVRVFARVTPQQKLRLVRALRANGEVVAMTGDGVNDAPALKAAHIGIAMGVRGTDVAREAAGLVLLEEDFGHIVDAVRMGRRISDNLRNVTTYIAAIHVPIAGLSLVPVVAGLPPLMLPAHVVLTEMVIDPVCSFAFEGAPERADVMRRPPREAAAGFFGREMVLQALLQGGLLFAAAFATYLAALRHGPPDAARAAALVALTVGNLGLVWLNASRGASWRAIFGAGYPAFWAVTAFATVTLGAGIAVPSLGALLQLAPPGGAAAALACVAGAGSVLLAAALQGRLRFNAPSAPARSSTA
ncbi:cation-translocating P-type ATPase [Ramlibacter albus]|uniref:HAD-IC family P-type ATPase n=1 Tax=Ramlibacter albus TaxID=2079448 RepID=A0A923M7E5_9BURK|nr:HAD-IC family P-type ATPase [Ramlibacter albus]MBC5763937.1 HAD-IC family P-type ATPase [Ramlibacter albus]